LIRGGGYIEDMGYEYEIECYSTERITDEELRSRLGVDQLDNREFTIQVKDSDKIYFCSHLRSDASRIAFAKLLEMALASNDAVVVKEI
jgi:hypothetical protein